MSQVTVEHTWQSGLRCHHAGRLGEAERAYSQVLDQQPHHADALHMLGVLYLQTGRPTQAIHLIRQALQLIPDCPQAHNNLAMALKANGQVDEALVFFSKAVELQPDYPAAFTNMGNVYMEQALHAKAERCYRQAMRLLPSTADVYGNVLYLMHFRSDYDAKTILEEHRQWAERHERLLVGEIHPHTNDPDPTRPLRIGYVSADFRDHPVGRFLTPLFTHHDRSQFQIWCYAHSTASADTVAQRLDACADRWQQTRGLSDAQLADQIRADQIDILVDLSQHTAGNRLLTFARKPAPVQVAWLGYPGTTGLAAMDYRLTDPYLDPPGCGDENYTERSIRLPHCFWCYPRPDHAPEVHPLPARQNRFVTFGCMNRFAKVTAPALQCLQRILQNVPNSRLLIHSKIGDHLDPVRRMFAAGGIASQRVEFVERKPYAQYIEQYHRIDIGLDPFPHGGGTVTCDSLWMGVPVVTLSGQTAVGRGGASLLSNVGLPELIAHTSEEYVSIAVGLAGNPAKLDELRQGLRRRMQSSPLMDGKQFSADIEAAYRQMWKKWCMGRS